MRKYPLFVLAAAAAMSIASVPMTAHAAAFQVTGGGNGMSGYFSGQRIAAFHNILFHSTPLIMI